MSYRLMVVDDSNIIRNRIERSFMESDIQIVATASNGVEALEKFAKTQPDLITMDLTMPQMDGIECIKRIIAQGTGVSILVVSALSDKETALLALQNGARGFICKPFNEEELSNALHRLIDMRNRTQ
ncbi:MULTISPECIES: response regulator [unclassified Moraxella]|uniref:response regulator n=1 Tax=unclassified Moraxella TaxID=2685852 RepID=UPI003AF951C5